MTNQYTPALERDNNFSPIKLREQPSEAQMLPQMAEPGKVILNVPSNTYLVPVEGLPTPIDSEAKTALLIPDKFKLRSPERAPKEEVDLTKRYINEQLGVKKKSRVIGNSVIKGRKYTTGDPSPSELNKEINMSNLTIRAED